MFRIDEDISKEQFSDLVINQWFGEVWIGNISKKPIVKKNPSRMFKSTKLSKDELLKEHRGF